MNDSARPAREANRRGEGSRLREEIVSAAGRLLATGGGAGGVTLRAIAREAGIAAPSVYLHFADRDAVLAEVVSRAFAELDESCRRAAAGAGTGAQEVAAIGAAYLAFARARPGAYRILFERGPADVARPPVAYPRGLEAFRLLTTAVTRMGEEGAAGVDPERDAQALWLLLHGLAVLVPATPGFPWVEPESLIASAVDRLRTAGGR